MNSPTFAFNRISFNTAQSPFVIHSEGRFGAKIRHDNFVFELVASAEIDMSDISNSVVTSIPYYLFEFEHNPSIWSMMEWDEDEWGSEMRLSKDAAIVYLLKYAGRFRFLQDDETLQIIVLEELTADFSADDTYNAYPLTVQFTAITNGRDYEGSQYIWEWAHEDDSGNWVEFSRVIDPEYIFELSGKYSIRFTVISPGGENRMQIIKENYIEARFLHDITIEYARWDV